MKLVYLTVDGRAKIESTKIRERLVEMPDGYHPITNDSVWQDVERKRDSMLMIVEGVRAPYGGTMETEDIKLLLYDMELKERAFKPQGVSKMWWRAFGRFGELLLKYGWMVFVAGMVAATLYQSFVGGGA